MQKELQMFAERSLIIKFDFNLGKCWITMWLYVNEILDESNIFSDSIGYVFFSFSFH